MKIEKIKSPNFDLSNLEKYIFNTIFLFILVYVFSVNYYKPILVSQELNNTATLLSFIMFIMLLFSRILSYQNKSVLILEENLWCYYKGNRKISFELHEISSINKSLGGIYSSFIIKIKNTQIRIPAETMNLTNFITNLSEHLSNKQVTEFLKFHQDALSVNFEVEKSSGFLRFFCFFIPVISFLIAKNIWESFSIIICIIWIVISLIYPIIWTTILWLVLKLTAKNFPVFLKVSEIWAICGVLLYMLIGIAYRNFYLWIIYLYK